MRFGISTFLLIVLSIAEPVVGQVRGDSRDAQLEITIDRSKILVLEAIPDADRQAYELLKSSHRPEVIYEPQLLSLSAYATASSR
jgi:hypothetical protein